MKTKQVTTTALLIALNIVLAQYLSINTALLKMNFGFASIALAGMMGGIPMAVTVATLGDVIGFFTRPQTAGLHLGFTLSAACIGLTYGKILFQKEGHFDKKQLLIRSALCALIVNGPISIGLNSYWLTQIQGVTAVLAAMPARIFFNCFVAAAQIVVIPVLYGMKTQIIDRLPERTTV